MFGFAIAVAAGFFTPQIQSSLAAPVAKSLSFLSIEESEHDVFGFMLAVLIAGFIATIIGSGNALGVALGLALGYFAMRIVDAVMSATNKSESE